MERLHARFLAIWPNARIPEAGSKSWGLFCAEWAEGLAGFSPAAIREAIAECRDTLEFPPTIAKFRAVCREHERRVSMDGLQLREMATELESWAERKQRARGHLSGLLALVRENQAAESRQRPSEALTAIEGGADTPQTPGTAQGGSCELPGAFPEGAA